MISLSYARSAGTGDQPVPGTVTSRRNSSRHERQALLRKRQEEDERLRKQKEEQDQIAKILAHKWAEEDRKKDARRRRGDRPREGSGDEDGGRQGASGKEEADAEAGGRGGDAEEEEEASERVAGWVTFERKAEKLREEKEVLHQLEAAKRGTTASSSSEPGGGSGQVRRFREEGGASERAGATPATSSPAGAGSGEGAREGKPGDSAKQVAVGPGRAHSTKVANVFGFGVEEDDEAGARREMELAARSKRAKLSLHSEALQVRTAEASEGGVRREGLPLPSATAARRPVDMCQQLMKMAQWKRSCGGKRLPMPKDLEENVAKAMGGLP